MRETGPTEVVRQVGWHACAEAEKHGGRKRRRRFRQVSPERVVQPQTQRVHGRKEPAGARRYLRDLGTFDDRADALRREMLPVVEHPDVRRRAGGSVKRQRVAVANERVIAPRNDGHRRVRPHDHPASGGRPSAGEQNVRHGGLQAQRAAGRLSQPHDVGPERNVVAVNRLQSVAGVQQPRVRARESCESARQQQRGHPHAQASESEPQVGRRQRDGQERCRRQRKVQAPPGEEAEGVPQRHPGQRQRYCPPPSPTRMWGRSRS